ncbi:MAG: hypothetical protein ACRCYA_08390 [Cetobacterium sp.]|uniref:hypothetical protein n=1 Tax=Cetobacterium sp. TaxID=2071632 RepID=UPI003F388DFC
MDTVTSDFIFNSVELRGIRHRFLSDSMGDILMTSNKYYDFDSAYFNTRTNFTFTVFRIGNPDFSIDNNNKVRIFGVGKIQ